MIVWFLFAWLLPSPLLEQAEQARPGCEGMKNETFVYIGGQQAATLITQRYTLKKIRGRSVAGIPLPGGRSGPRYQVQVAKKPQPVAVAESRPVFHLASQTPVERIAAIRLNPCGKNDCFNLYEDGLASMALVRLESRALGPACYEFHPERPLSPGEYALVILDRDLKPEQVARFVAGPTMPDIEIPK